MIQFWIDISITTTVSNSLHGTSLFGPVNLASIITMANWGWHHCDGDGCFADVVCWWYAAIPPESFETADRVIPRAAAGGWNFAIYTG